MSDPYVGEIRIFAGNFAPAGWAMCDGSLLAISGNEVLFQLIGTTYGGDGQNTFALPDLRSRVPIHQGGGFAIGAQGGTETVTLTTQQIPSHQHRVTALSAGGSVNTPGTGVLLATPSSPVPIYAAPATNVPLSAAAVSSSGGQPHSNTQPYLAISYIIALFGVFPSRN